MGLQQNVPAVARKPWGIFACLLNLLPVTPGWGTMIAAARADDTSKFGIGFAQFALLWVGVAVRAAAEMVGLTLALVALLWSILWGILILARSK